MVYLFQDRGTLRIQQMHRGEPLTLYLLYNFHILIVNSLCSYLTLV